MNTQNKLGQPRCIVLPLYDLGCSSDDAHILENLHVEPSGQPVDQTASSSIRTAIMAISGMDCPLCMMRVRNGLLSSPGVLLAHVYLVSAVAIVAYDHNRVAVRDLMGSVTEAGLDVRHHYQAQVLSVKPETAVFAAAT